jgi:hypothetical protein
MCSRVLRRSIARDMFIEAGEAAWSRSDWGRYHGLSR